MFFRCNVCLEKENRISDLRFELERVHALLKSYVSPNYSPALTADLNNALEGAGTPQIELTPEQQEQMHKAEQQAIDLLTGNY